MREAELGILNKMLRLKYGDRQWHEYIFMVFKNYEESRSWYLNKVLRLKYNCLLHEYSFIVLKIISVHVFLFTDLIMVHSDNE